MHINYNTICQYQAVRHMHQVLKLGQGARKDPSICPKFCVKCILRQQFCQFAQIIFWPNIDEILNLTRKQNDARHQFQCQKYNDIRNRTHYKYISLHLIVSSSNIGN